MLKEAICIWIVIYKKKYKNIVIGLKGNDDMKRNDTVNSTASTTGSKNSNTKTQQVSSGNGGGKKAFKRMSTNKIVINAVGKK